MRRRLALVAALVMLAGVVTGVSAAPALADTGCPIPVAYPGDGNLADPFVVSVPGHLQYLRDTPADWNKTVVLAADIDMGGCVWDKPIGTGPFALPLESSSWQGRFDGQGHVIAQLDVHVTMPLSVAGKYYAGLFGYSTGVIQNVGFTGNVSVTASYVGAGEIYAGGLVGYASPSVGQTLIVESFAAGDVTVNVTATADGAGAGDASADVRVGGLVGRSQAEIFNSYSLSTLNNTVSLTGRGETPATGTATVSYRLGGLVGQQTGDGLSGSIANSYSAGSSSDSIVASGFDSFFATTLKGGAVGEHLGGTNSNVVWPSALWPGGVGGGNAAGLIGATSTEIREFGTFDNLGWYIAKGYSAATTWSICPYQNDGYPFLSQFQPASPDPCAPECEIGATQVFDDTDIQAAVLASRDDSVICIAADIELSGTLVLDDTTVTLEGGNYLAALDGADARQILNVDFTGAGDDTLIVRDLALRDGDAMDGGAIRVTNFGGPVTDQLIIVDVSIDSSEASSEGGAIYSRDVPVSLTRLVATRNVATAGGAVFADDAPISSLGSIFSGNSAALGGAITSHGPLTSADDSFVSNRTTTSDGGAIWGGGAVSLTNSDFEGNTTLGAGSDGGAVAARGNVTVSEGWFIRNTATADGGAIRGEAAVVVSGSTFELNSAMRKGGGLWAANLTVLASTLTRNGSLFAGSAGGGAFADDTLAVTNVTSHRNEAATGGFLALGAAARSADLRYVTSLDDFSNQGASLARAGSGAVNLHGVVLSAASAVDRCYDSAGAADFVAGSSGSVVSDYSCGFADDSIEFASAAAIAFTSPITTDDTPGTQVLIPAASSVLINAIPSTLVAGVTTDQLGVSRAVPMGLTTVGAVQVLPTPAFTASPQGQTVMVGSPATFSSAASGGTGVLTYQWERSFDNGVNWAAIPGATNLTYSVASTVLAENGVRYRNVATDGNGRQAASAAATLTVSAPPAPGPGPAPAPSPSPTPSPSPSPTRPGAPTITGVIPGDDSVVVSFQSVDDTIEGYEYSLDDSTWISHDPMVTSPPMVIDGLQPGTTYSLRLRAVNEAGAGESSASVEFTTREAVSLLITGSRRADRIKVLGTTTGLVGQVVTPRVKLRGQRFYASGRVEPIVDDAGRFEWSRKTGKKAYVYFQSEGIRSNSVTIPARMGSRR